MNSLANFYADIWGPVERGNAMALFSCMTFIVCSISPDVCTISRTLTSARDLLSAQSSQDSYSSQKTGAGAFTYCYG